MDRINQRIASELGVQVAQVAAAVDLLGEGATVPFIARYRKEKTGGLDDTQLRKLEERLGYLRELEDRRATVLKSIEEQGKLTPELARSISGAETKVELEDLYAPYRPKRRTKAQIAREAGLEPLGDALLANPALDPEAEAAKFVDADKGVADAKAALDGARHILIERIGRGADRWSATLREWEWGEGVLASKVPEGQGRGGRQVLRLFRLRPAHQGHALAPRARHAARPQRGRARPRPRRGARGGQAASGRGQDHGRPSTSPSAAGRPTRWLAETVRLAWKAQARPVARCRPAGAPQGARRRRGDLRVLQEPEGPAARGAGRPARHHGARSGHPHRRQGRDRRRRPARCVETATIYPHEPRRDWAGLARHAGRAVHEAQGRSRQRRQRHGQPRDRQAGRRADRQDARARSSPR